VASTTKEYKTSQSLLTNAMATPDRDESSIPELQAALGPLLLTRASPSGSATQAPGSYSVARGCPDTLPPKEQVLPKWTGAFKLFDFPRELRDRIYYYVVYVPGGIHYTTHTNADLQNRPSSDIVNMLLVSKQVYQEALQMFGRSNTVALSTRYSPREGYRKPLTGLLRLFPDPAADALTKVSHVYHDTIARPSGIWGYAPSHGSIADGGDGTGHFHKRQQPGETFLEILRDAHAVAQRFPKLRVFDVVWYVGSGFHEYPIPECVVRNIAKFLKNSGSQEEAVKMWLDLMRGWLQKGNVVPLQCVWFIPQGFRADGFGWDLEQAANEAYQMVVREMKDREDIEASGKVWLEEMEAANRTKKKRKSGRKTAQK
jgi:SAM-dependent methyltransferase